MPTRISYAEEYSAAFSFSMRNGYLSKVVKAMNKEFPDLGETRTEKISASAFARAGRVKYMTESNPGWFLNKDKINCPDGGNYLYFNWQVTFKDDSDNVFERNITNVIEMEIRIGQNIDSSMVKVLQRLKDKYFNDLDLAQIRGQIIDARIVNVKCLTGGEGQ
jgi:hypothetical protein